MTSAMGQSQQNPTMGLDNVPKPANGTIMRGAQAGGHPPGLTPRTCRDTSVKTIKRIALSLALITGLAACDQPATPTVRPSAPAAPAHIGPGDAQIGIKTFSSLFRTICATPFPNLSQSRANLAANGFHPHPSSGTYYDNRRDVSFSLKPSRGKRSCSMVFTSRAKPGMLAFETSKISETVPQNVIVFFRVRGIHDGRQFYRTQVVAQ